ncbi:hypothetical protein J6590_049637 [Homalodisca vitripennis]|nr:hypothetical protein J6590_049637 [Homalodisca vitripennis]
MLLRTSVSPMSNMPTLAEQTVTGQNHILQGLRNWLFPQVIVDSDNFIYQQDGAPPHWHKHVCRSSMPTCLHALHSWPHGSLDLTTCDLFLWGYVKERVNVPPLPRDIDELKYRISAAVASVTEDTLITVWN